MKQRVDLSTFSLIVTVLCIGIFIGLFFIDQSQWWYWLCSIIVIMILVAGLWYSPMWISVDDEAVSVHRSLSIRELPLSEIKSVRLCNPTMGAKRVCGSGGFMGYWGWFSEKDLGKYFAYYGKASDCFFVEMASGHNYMLGCRHARAMVEAITQKLRRR